MRPPAGRSVVPPQATTGGGPRWVFIHAMKSDEVLPGFSLDRMNSWRCAPRLRTAILCHPRVGGRDQGNVESPNVIFGSAAGHGATGAAMAVTVNAFIIPLAKCSTRSGLFTWQKAT